MPSQEDIDQQLELLATHRRTLTHFLRQRAQLGEAHEPPGVSNGIRLERENIARCKETLRAWGVPVEDYPADFEKSQLLMYLLKAMENLSARRTKRRSNRSQASGQLEAIGITGFLPVDYFIYLEQPYSIEHAKKEARAVRSLASGFIKSITRDPVISGGGKVANIVAYLGFNGHDVALSGAVGGDIGGEYVINELEDFGVEAQYIKKGGTDSITKVVFLIYKDKMHSSDQVPLKTLDSAGYVPRILVGTPY